MAPTHWMVSDNWCTSAAMIGSLVRLGFCVCAEEFHTEQPGAPVPDSICCRKHHNKGAYLVCMNEYQQYAVGIWQLGQYLRRRVTVPKWEARKGEKREINQYGILYYSNLCRCYLSVLNCAKYQRHKGSSSGNTYSCCGL